jgi:hypothetical protein
MDVYDLSFDCILLLMSKVDRPSLEVFKLVSIGLNMVSNPYRLKSKVEFKRNDVFISSLSRFKFAYGKSNIRRPTILTMKSMILPTIMKGDVRVLKYFQRWVNIRTINRDLCSIAACREGPEMLKYLHSIGCPLTKYTAYNAAEGGNLEMMKYLIANDCPLGKSILMHVAVSGNVEMMKYLCETKENKKMLDSNVSTTAAFHGHLEMLKYLHSIDCPWNEGTCVGAAENGQIECLKYAHENGCYWNESVRTIAAANNQIECLEYALANNCPGKATT